MSGGWRRGLWDFLPVFLLLVGSFGTDNSLVVVGLALVLFEIIDWRRQWERKQDSSVVVINEAGTPGGGDS